jgi:hypothetical protein
MWEPAQNTWNMHEMVDEFHRDHLRKPGQWLEWRSSIEHFAGVLLAYILTYLGPVQMVSAQEFATSGHMSRGRGVSPFTKSTVRLLIRHWPGVGLTTVVRRCTQLCFVFHIGFLLLIHVCSSQGYLLLKGGNDVMAVMIRFSPMACDGSSAG